VTDALHVMILRTHDIDQIMTFARGFERYRGVRRICA
jgi:predicted nucleic acid-binding protein